MATKVFHCLILVFVLLTLSSPKCDAFGNGAIPGKRSFQEKRVSLAINFLVHIYGKSFLTLGWHIVWERNDCKKMCFSPCALLCL